MNNVLTQLIYLSGIIVTGVTVHYEAYGVAAGVAMAILVDVISGLEKEDTGA
ncbi:hypothetical protein ACQR3P_29290 [Rhodococcus sp. IEGM1300]